MEIIRHRRNTRAELEATPASYGVEVDIRSRGERLIVHHDPFCDGEDFDAWLKSYRHGTLILNVKEEGLEGRLLDLVGAAGLDRFFFLDQSFPFLIRTARTGERRCAVRVSEYEAVESALTLAGMVDWVWVDCFSKFPISGEQAARLQSAGFSLCLVSPELQGRALETIADFRRELSELGVSPEAVCTKAPELWS